MTTIDLAPPAAPGVPRLGQGTAIEQSRAVAQVQAAVLVARQWPRNVQAAINAMQEACARPSLAKTAFYEYRRGDTTVQGPTIKLLQELGRIWGNLDFGMAELSIDHAAGQSEMLAFAWDLESNSRFSQIVIVQHVRDKTVKGTKVAEQLHDRRDVYEVNTSNAARRLRECIRRVIPDWFLEEAVQRCYATLENPGDGLTLAQRIARVTRGFENAWGIDVARLEARLGKPMAEWNGRDVAQLQITGDSIKDGNLAVDDAFPQRVTAAEVASARTKPSTPQASPPPEEPPGEEAAGPQPPAAEAPAEPTPPSTPQLDKRPATNAQLTRLHTLLSVFGVTERADKLQMVGLLIGQRLASSKDLTRSEAVTVIDQLEGLSQQDDPARALDLVLSALEQADAAAQPDGGA